MVTPDVGTGLFQYFIKIIPTVYTNVEGRKLLTNQYTITEKFRPFALASLTPGAALTQVRPTRTGKRRPLVFRVLQYVFYVAMQRVE